MSMFATRSAAIVLVFVAGVAQATFAQSIQPGSISVELQLVATAGTGASAPNFGANSGDSRFLYVGQKTGAIRILDFDQPNPLLGTNFLNVSTALATFRTPTQAFHEYGLLGGAFHPNFHDDGMPGFGKFYTYTSENIVTPVTFTHSEIGNGGDHQSVIREWTAGAPNEQGVITIDTSTASRVLMRINQPQGNHNGGGLAFGHDDYLYISLGDGGSGNDFSGNRNSTTDGHTNLNDPNSDFGGHGNGQDRRNVFGSILRIQPTIEDDPLTTLSTNGQYRVPNNNPFTEASHMVDPIPGWQADWVDEIFAFGLRNPFRISVDRETGKVYAGDVGQGTREEVNLITSGGNYGWVAREGLIQNPTYPLTTDPTYVAPPGAPFIDPLGDYPNGTGGGIAVIGGYVYRGSTIAALQGKYIFGDLSRNGVPGGGLMYMDVDEPGPNQVFDLVITGSPAKPSSDVHGLAEDANGEVYYLFANGQIIKLFLEPIPGDYNGDRIVDRLDYDLWQATFGMTGANLPADGNGDDVVDAADYVHWRNNAADDLGAGSGRTTVPEPAAIALAFPLCVVLATMRRRRRRVRQAFPSD